MANENQDLLIVEHDRIASELETIIDERSAKGEQRDRVIEAEKRFAEAIAPFEEVENDIKELDAESLRIVVDYFPTHSSINKKLFIWSCIATGFNLSELQILTNTSGMSSFAVFGISLHGISTEEVNFGFLAVLIYYKIKVFWLSCAQNSAFATYLARFRKKFSKIVSKRDLIRERLSQLGEPDIHPEMLDVKYARLLAESYRYSHQARHSLPSLIHLIVPQTGTLIATLSALIFLNFETKLPLPILDSPNKLGALFILLLGGIGVFLSTKNKADMDISALSQLRRIQPYS